MKWHEKRFFFGISLKISLGLAVIVLVACISGGISKRYFEKFDTLFESISGKQLPLLLDASRLAKEAEGLISVASELALAENPIRLESLSRNIKKDFEQIQNIISRLDAAGMNNSPDLSGKIEEVLKNLRKLRYLNMANMDMNRRITQLSILMRETSDSLIIRKEQDPEVHFLYHRFIRIFSLLRDVPSVSDNQQLKEYGSQVVELKKAIDQGMENESVNVKPLRYYFTILERYGLGENGLLALAEIYLRQKKWIHDKVVQNAFLSDELVKQTEQIFLKISTDIQQQGQIATREIGWIGKLFLLIPVIILISAVFIFLFIHRSVIRRILALEQSMKAHVEGNPLPISTGGTDEVAGMAKSVAYFVQKKNEDEAHLQEANTALQTALDEITTLRGILPICSHCKKIRDDKGYWNRIEDYIYEHSDAELSHGICPECADKYYPEYDLYE